MSTSHTRITCSYPTCREFLQIDTSGLSWDEMTKHVEVTLRRAGWMFSGEQDRARYYHCPTHAWEMEPIR